MLHALSQYDLHLPDRLEPPNLEKIKSDVEGQPIGKVESTEMFPQQIPCSQQNDISDLPANEQQKLVSQTSTSHYATTSTPATPEDLPRGGDEKFWKTIRKLYKEDKNEYFQKKLTDFVDSNMHNSKIINKIGEAGSTVEKAYKDRKRKKKLSRQYSECNNEEINVNAHKGELYDQLELSKEVHKKRKFTTVATRIIKSSDEKIKDKKNTLWKPIKSMMHAKIRSSHTSLQKQNSHEPINPGNSSQGINVEDIPTLKVELVEHNSDNDQIKRKNDKELVENIDKCDKKNVKVNDLQYASKDNEVKEKFPSQEKSEELVRSETQIHKDFNQVKDFRSTTKPNKPGKQSTDEKDADSGKNSPKQSPKKELEIENQNLSLSLQNKVSCPPLKNTELSLKYYGKSTENLANPLVSNSIKLTPGTYRKMNGRSIPPSPLIGRKCNQYSFDLESNVQRFNHAKELSDLEDMPLVRGNELPSDVLDSSFSNISEYHLNHLFEEAVGHGRTLDEFDEPRGHSTFSNENCHRINKFFDNSTAINSSLPVNSFTNLYQNQDYPFFFPNKDPYADETIQYLDLCCPTLPTTSYQTNPGSQFYPVSPQSSNILTSLIEKQNELIRKDLDWLHQSSRSGYFPSSQQLLQKSNQPQQSDPNFDQYHQLKLSRDKNFSVGSKSLVPPQRPENVFLTNPRNELPIHLQPFHLLANPCFSHSNLSSVQTAHPNYSN